jgi:hypothetical protein
MDALTRNLNGTEVLKITAYRALLPSKFVRAERLGRVDPVAVRQRLQATSNTAGVL